MLNKFSMEAIEDIILLKKTPVCACFLLKGHVGILFRSKYKFLKKKGKEFLFLALPSPSDPLLSFQGSFLKHRPLPCSHANLLVIPPTSQAVSHLRRYVEAVLSVGTVSFSLSFHLHQGLLSLGSVCLLPRQTPVWLCCGHTPCAAFTTSHHLLVWLVPASWDGPHGKWPNSAFLYPCPAQRLWQHQCGDDRCKQR